MDEAWRLVGMAGEAGGPTVGPGEGVLVAVVDWCRVVRRTGRQAFDGVALGLGRIVLLGVPAARCDVPADRKGGDARVPADPRQRRPVCRSGSQGRRMWLGLQGWPAGSARSLWPSARATHRLVGLGRSPAKGSEYQRSSSWPSPIEFAAARGNSRPVTYEASGPVFFSRLPSLRAEAASSTILRSASARLIRPPSPSDRSHR